MVYPSKKGVSSEGTSSHLLTGTEHPSFKRFFLMRASDEVGCWGQGGTRRPCQVIF